MDIGGIDVQVSLPKGRYGIVIGRGCAVAPSSGELAEALDGAIAAAKAREGAEATTKVVRDLFRNGKYKPTGRGKPASEYLFKAAQDDRFPRINNLVDINNLISLETLIPISLVDLGRAATTQFILRLGRAEERFVFNAAGQVIDVQDLIVVARLPADEACANAVKDSMATKLTDEAEDVMAVLYAPDALEAEVTAAVSRFAALLERWGGAKQTHHAVLSGEG